MKPAKPTIEEAREYPQSMGAAFALRANREFFDEILVRAVEIATEQNSDLLRDHVEQAVEERSQ